MDNMTNIFKWKGKNLDDLNLRELSKLKYIVSCLPKGIKVTISSGDKTYKYFDDYFMDRINNFFNATREDYEKIVGKCFKSEDRIIKVLGMSDGHDFEFLYEEHEKYRDDSWHNKDYIWLQDTAYGRFPHKEYEKYCLTPQTEMNIASESMYQLGKDGNLYVDTDCGGNYEVFKEVKESLFEVIREEALENDGEIEGVDA